MDAQTEPIVVEDNLAATRQVRRWRWPGSLGPGQFRLSAVLFGTAIVAVVLAGWRISRELNAPYRAMEALGATVKFYQGAHYPGGRCVLIDLNGAAVSDRDLRILRRIKIKLELDASGTAISDAGIEQLIAIPLLSGVDLYGTHVTEAGMERLRDARPDVSIGPRKLSRIRR